jgi:serine/threonine-protein kinase
MLIQCPQCETRVAGGARFCTTCGQRLDVDPAWDATVGERLAVALGPKYHLLGELGRGGFAIVFSVRDLRRGRYLAVKVMRPSLLSARHMAERFQREVELAGQLDHPNIVPVLFSGRSGGLVYYAMPRVKGETLARRIEQRGALSLPEIVRIFGGIAGGLGHAHARSVVHRDVKPANILLDEHDTPRLLDFGIAKGLASKGESISITGEIIGSAEYMSPERAQGEATVDHRCDIYSLGVVAFEMLTGRLPFHGKTVHEVLLKHVEEAPPDPRTLRADAPPNLVMAILSCLEKSPERRWASAAAAARAAGASV